MALTRRPGACLDGMAGQCPCGRPGATWGSLHCAAPGPPHLGTSTGDAHTPWQPQTCAASTGKRSGRVSSSEAIGADKNPSGDWPQISRRGEGFQVHLMEEEEGSGAHRLPRCQWRKSPEMAGICRRRRRHWLQERAREKERGRVSEAEWARSVWPTQTRVYRVSKWGGLGLAIGPRPNIFKSKWICQFCFS
jgi:hypothetical protein